VHFIAAIIVMGAGGVIAQVLLLRELLIVFSGNELSIGIILANWLILEAAGSFLLGRAIEKTARKIEAYALVQNLFALFLPAAVFATRTLSAAMRTVPGEGFGFETILYFSFLILLPVSLFHGALFTFGCRIWAQIFKNGETGAGPIGRVYIYETVGTIMGGLAFVYFLIPSFHSFQIALFIASLNLLMSIFILGFDRSVPRTCLSVISLLLLACTCWLLAGRGAEYLHRLSIHNQWKGQEVVYYQNSIYGNITVIENEGQYTFFADGIPAMTTPMPDIEFVEELAHLTMLAHPDPQEVLIVSNGAGGVIAEVLKHPQVHRIDYTELDPLMLTVLRLFPTPLTTAELNNSKVTVHDLDGRLYIQNTPRTYDVIILGLSDPSDLQVNRLFTREFFSLAGERLNPEGVLAFTLPGSVTYLGEELKKLNSCIYSTLRSVFPYIRIIPGAANIFLASSSPALSLIDDTILGRRLRQRNLNTKLLTSGHIEYKLDEVKREWILAGLDPDTKKNLDFLPTAVFHSLSYRNALFSPSLQRWARRIESLTIPHLILCMSFITGIFVFICVMRRRDVGIGVAFPILCTGFSGMIYDLIIVFAFQVFCGYVFHQIGILITALMAGTGAGSFLVTALLKRLKRDTHFFIMTECALVLFSLLLPVFLYAVHSGFPDPRTVPLVRISLPVLSVISGFLIGAQFPLAAKLYSKHAPAVSATAGLLYACDLFGGYIGGLAGGLILLPLFGLIHTCIIVVLVKICSLIVLLICRRGDAT
jgi:spermidine synthase